MGEPMLVTLYKRKKRESEKTLPRLRHEVAYSIAAPTTLVLSIIAGCYFHFYSLIGQPPVNPDWLSCAIIIVIFMFLWMLFAFFEWDRMLLALFGWDRWYATSSYLYDRSLVKILCAYTAVFILVSTILLVHFLPDRRPWPTLLICILLPLLLWLWSYLNIRSRFVWLKEIIQHDKGTTLATPEELADLDVEQL